MIERKITSSEGMIAVLSPDAVVSQHWKNEIAFARHHEKMIIPLLWRQCPVPIELIRLHRVNFTGDFQKALAELLRKIRPGRL